MESDRRQFILTFDITVHMYGRVKVCVYAHTKKEEISLFYEVTSPLRSELSLTSQLSVLLGERSCHKHGPILRCVAG